MPSQGLANLISWLPSWLLPVFEVALVFIFGYLVLHFLGQPRTRTYWIIQGFIILVAILLATMYLCQFLGFQFLSFILEKMLISCAVGIVVILQSEFRRFLEQLGRGEFNQLLPSSSNTKLQPDHILDEILDAVRELSQKRIGALLLIETNEPIDPSQFRSRGVTLNAEVSSELIQTLFQTTTILHDGAVLLRGSRIAAASVILPLTEKNLSRQLGTRHRAAIGISEKVSNCLCIVVSEETGSISLAEQGTLKRPLTRSRLRELLQSRFSPVIERETVRQDVTRLTQGIRSQGTRLLQRSVRFFSSKSHRKK